MMRAAFILSILIVCLLFSSCRHRARGPRPLSAADSARRAAAIADRQQLKELEKVREDLEGPPDTASGTCEVTKGAKYGSSILDDSTTAVLKSFDRLNARDRKRSGGLYHALWCIGQ
jgi:hypothetical protein